MDSEPRIRRMESDGTLSPRQAEVLRAALSGAHGRSNAAPAGRQPLPLWIIVSAIMVVVVGLLLVVPDGAELTIQDVSTGINQPGDYGEMNKSLSTGLAVVALLIVPVLLWIWLHNSLVTKEEKVFEAWAQTESNFQRRADLIPALIDTVSRYLRHETETLTEVTQARGAAAQSLSGTIDALIRAQEEVSDRRREPDSRIIEDEDALARLFDAHLAVGRSVNQLLGVVENYPELRSSDQFLELQAQLEGTENRINVARMRFNTAVRDYNAAIRQVPGSLVARVASFQRKAYFESAEDARDAPALQFE